VLKATVQKYQGIKARDGFMSDSLVGEQLRASENQTAETTLIAAASPLKKGLS